MMITTGTGAYNIRVINVLRKNCSRWLSEDREYSTSENGKEQIYQQFFWSTDLFLILAEFIIRRTIASLTKLFQKFSK